MQDISPAELKRNLFLQLKESGALGSLKSQLRSHLLERLRSTGPGGPEPPPGTQGVLERVLNSLIAEYFKSRGYIFSLSVFQPECGASTSAPILTRDEITRLLGLDGSSPISRYLEPPPPPASFARPGAATAAPSTPLALQLLRAVSEGFSSGARHDSATQTAENSEASLQLQLHQLEEVYMRRIHAERANPLWTVEDRMAAFRKECEERMKVEVELQVQRVRELEVSSIRLHESARYRRLMDQERQELDRQYLERSTRLKEREERMQEKYRRVQLELDAREYQHRQKAAAEEDRLAAQRAVGEREAEGRDAALRDKEERLKRLEEVLQDRQRDADRLRQELVAEADRARDTARVEAWEELASQRDQLRSDRLALEKDKARLAEQREEWSDQLIRARALSDKLRASEALRVDAEARSAALSASEEHLRGHLSRLEEDNKQLRRALSTAADQAAAHRVAMTSAVQPEVDRARQEAVDARRQVMEYKAKLARYKDAMDEAEEEIAMLEENEGARAQEVRRLELLLDEAVRARDETLAKFEEARLALASAQRESADMRVRCDNLMRRLQSPGGAMDAQGVPRGLQGGAAAGASQLPYGGYSAESDGAAAAAAQEPLQLGPALSGFLSGRAAQASGAALSGAAAKLASAEDLEMEARLAGLAREEERIRRDLADFRKRIAVGEPSPAGNDGGRAKGGAGKSAGRRDRERERARSPSASPSSSLGGPSEASYESRDSSEERRRDRDRRRRDKEKEREKDRDRRRDRDRDARRVEAAAAPALPPAPAPAAAPAPPPPWGPISQAMDAVDPSSTTAVALGIARVLENLMGQMGQQPQRGPGAAGLGAGRSPVEILAAVTGAAMPPPVAPPSSAPAPQAAAPAALEPTPLAEPRSRHPSPQGSIGGARSPPPPPAVPASLPPPIAAASLPTRPSLSPSRGNSAAGSQNASRSATPEDEPRASLPSPSPRGPSPSHGPSPRPGTAFPPPAAPISLPRHPSPRATRDLESPGRPLAAAAASATDTDSALTGLARRSHSQSLGAAPPHASHGASPAAATMPSALPSAVPGLAAREIPDLSDTFDSLALAADNDAAGSTRDGDSLGVSVSTAAEATLQLPFSASETTTTGPHDASLPRMEPSALPTLHAPRPSSDADPTRRSGDAGDAAVAASTTFASRHDISSVQGAGEQLGESGFGFGDETLDLPSMALGTSELPASPPRADSGPGQAEAEVPQSPSSPATVSEEELHPARASAEPAPRASPEIMGVAPVPPMDPDLYDEVEDFYRIEDQIHLSSQSGSGLSVPLAGGLGVGSQEGSGTMEVPNESSGGSVF